MLNSDSRGRPPHFQQAPHRDLGTNSRRYTDIGAHARGWRGKLSPALGREPLLTPSRGIWWPQFPPHAWLLLRWPDGSSLPGETSGTSQSMRCSHWGVGTSSLSPFHNWLTYYRLAILRKMTNPGSSYCFCFKMYFLFKFHISLCAKVLDWAAPTPCHILTRPGALLNSFPDPARLHFTSAPLCPYQATYGGLHRIIWFLFIEFIFFLLGTDSPTTCLWANMEECLGPRPHLEGLPQQTHHRPGAH